MALTINEEVVSKSGVKFPRAYAAGLSYKHGEVPFLEWFLETLTVYDDGSTLSESPPVDKIKSEYNETLTYPLINPETGETIGTASDQQLFCLLYSRFIRDLTAWQVTETARLAAGQP